MKKIKKSGDDILFDTVNHILTVLVILACTLPFAHIIAKSLSNNTAVIAGKVLFLPRGFNTDSYRIVFGSTRFLRSLGVSVYVTVIGTLLNTLMTTCVAYTVSRDRLRGRKAIMFLYVFSMLFNGGLIPTYLIVKATGLVNSLWALIIPTLVVPFNMIILRNYFWAIPNSLEESAKLDGASNVTILFRIMAPLAMPSIATIALFYGVTYWNSYFNALIYINDRMKFPLQVYLRDIITQSDSAMMNADLMMNIAQESVQGATVVAATVPILLVYPFLQRYFVSGMTVGSVKG